MRFEEHYMAETIDWQEHIKDNVELPGALEIMKKITDAGYEALIVGGFVRDLVMGVPSADVDISTNMPEAEVAKLFDTIDVGKSKDFGVNVIKYKGQTYEIAQYRKDIYDNLENGKGASEVSIASSFEDDSERRDFKLNSLGIDAEGNIVDHHGGLKDIKNKVITAVGDADMRFKEDEVRTLRGVRFSSRLGFKIDDKTMEAIKSHAPNIQKVAMERVLKELVKMASQSGDKFADAILILKDSGLLKYILPEVLQLSDFQHSQEHHPESKDVLGHVIAALRSSKSLDPIVQLAILMHDLGKISTYSLGDDGVHHYFGHASAAEELIDVIADRLKMPNDMRTSIKFAAINHMKLHELLKMSPNKVMQLMNDPNWDILMSVAKADAMARGDMFDEKEWSQIEARVADLKKKFSGKQATDAIRKVVNGKWVIELLSLNPKKDGPKIGEVIKQTVEWIINDNINIEDLDAIKKKIMEYA